MQSAIQPPLTQHGVAIIVDYVNLQVGKSNVSDILLRAKWCINRHTVKSDSVFFVYGLEIPHMITRSLGTVNIGRAHK
jgi:hypothetical protein